MTAPSSPQLASRRPSGLTLSECTIPGCACCTRTHSKLGICHQRSRPSLPPLISLSPLGAQVTAETTPGCPTKRSEEHTSELQSHSDLVCRLLLEKKKKK